MKKTPKREPRDPTRRLEATLKSNEFRNVVQAYRRAFGLPRKSHAIRQTDSSRPDEVDWEKARLYDKGMLGEMARAVERICDWLNVSCEAISVLAAHVFYNAPIPPGEFVNRFADPLQKATLQRMAKLGEFRPPESVAAIHGRRAARILAMPTLLRQDLPLLLLVEETPEASWAERVQLWNKRFPDRQVYAAQTLARYYRAARQRDIQRRAAACVPFRI